MSDCEACAHADATGYWPQHLLNDEGTHCGGQSLSLFAVRDSDPCLTPDGMVDGFQPSPHGGRVKPEIPADLDGRHPGVVKPLHFFHVDKPVGLPMLLGAQHNKVLWSVIGLDVVSVVDVSVGEAHDKSMFVSLEVVLSVDSPPDDGIPVRSNVPTWLTFGNLIHRVDMPYTSFGVGSVGVTGVAPLFPVTNIDHLESAVNTAANGVELAHNPMLAVIHGCHLSWTGKSRAHCASCHQTFTSDGLANRHRKGDRCLTTTEMLEAEDKHGDKVFGQTDTRWGVMWRHPETLMVRVPKFQVKG